MIGERCEACGGELAVVSPPNTSPLALRCRLCGREAHLEVQYAPPPSPPAAEPDAPFPRAALDALDAGNKIEAIKILRAATGLGLKDAKEVVERQIAGEAPFLPHQLPARASNAFPAAAVTALQGGRFIEAVRIVREARGIGLRDAKVAVDRYVASDPLLRDRIAARRAEQRRNALLWGIALALIAALIVYSLAKP